jgi:peptidoglycan/xylan/chitin deacetylase (PgdA/CDA1 family)
MKTHILRKATSIILGVAAFITNFSAIPAFAAGPNIVPNPSLESSSGANPTSWARGRWGTNTAVFTYPVLGFDGLRAAKVELTSRTSGDAKWYFSHVAVTPGQKYDFSNYYQATVQSYLTVEYKMSNGSFQYKDIAVLPAAPIWTKTNASFTVPSGVVSLTVFHLIKVVGSLTVDAYSLQDAGSSIPPAPGGFSQGFVSLNFDDGHISTYQNALPKLNAAGFKSTQYIVSGRLSGYSGYVSRDQVLAMQSQGHEIGAHTRTHSDLTAMSESQMRSEILGSKADLLNAGVNSVTTFSYPFGAYNSMAVNIAREGFASARTSNGGFVMKGEDPHTLEREGVKINTTMDQIKGWIDKAVQDKYWLVLVFHDVNNSGGEYSATPETLQQTIDYLKSKGVSVKTMAEGMAAMAQ